MPIKITIERIRPSADIPFYPDKLSSLYAELRPKHDHNILMENISLSEDDLVQTVVMIWKDVESLAAWNEDRTTSLEIKETMLIEYHRRMGISYWSWQEWMDEDQDNYDIDQARS